MRYPINKVWVVITTVFDEVEVYTFPNRYSAFNFFTKVKGIIETKFPNNESVFDHNSSGQKGNSFYGLVYDKISVRLSGIEMCSRYSTKTFEETLEEHLEVM